MHMTGSEFFWEIFTHTGSPTAYLVYKEVREEKTDT
jgi:hypothetical protein